MGEGQQGKAHPGDGGRRALGRGVAAQGLVHTPALSAAPHTPVGGVGGQAQAAVAAAEGAVVEGHCGGELLGQLAGQSAGAPSAPRPAPDPTHLAAGCRCSCRMT